MSEIEFNVVGADKIILPIELADSQLSLAEIGALFCFYAFAKDSERASDGLQARIDSPEVKEMLVRFAKLGVIQITADNGCVINFDPLLK